MKFLFDLDETLVCGDVIEAVSRDMVIEGELDRVYTGRDVTNFDLEGLPPHLKTRVIEGFSDPKYVITKQPIPEAYYFLCALKANGHKMGILTARPSNLRNITIHNTRKQFAPIYFELGICFANDKDTVATGDERPNKRARFHSIQPDYYFDDSIEYCNQAADCDVKNVYLISNSHSGWNHNQDTLDPRVKVIKHVGKLDIWSVYGRKN